MSRLWPPVVLEGDMASGHAVGVRLSSAVGLLSCSKIKISLQIKSGLVLVYSLGQPTFLFIVMNSLINNNSLFSVRLIQFS